MTRNILGRAGGMPDTGLKDAIRNIPGFPKEGIVFRDITTLLKNGTDYTKAVDELASHYDPKDIDLVLGIESRGFILGGALAYKWGCGFIPARKPGKLPAATYSEEYSLEYGTDSLELHQDAIEKGSSVLIVDDLLATGGTAKATAALVEKAGGVIVGIAFLIELAYLNGREKIAGYPVLSLVTYDSE
jgi:adenine phosphoribosyltransferase